MAPQVREKDSEKEIEQAREKLRESGEGSIFDTFEGKPLEKIVKAKKPKADTVSRT